MKKFILLEGGDGVGKSSCAIEIAKAINGIYYKTPPPIFDSLRQPIDDTKDYSLRFYYYLTGVIYSSKEISELLKTTHVVCDRYLYTTIAYHEALGVNIPEGLEDLILKPDYCFCIHADPEIIRERVSQREFLGAFDNAFDFQQQVFEKFKKFNFELFDTSGLTVEESTKRLLQKINLSE